MAAALRARPMAMGTREPMRPAMRPASGATMTTMPVAGMDRRPAWKAVYPCTFWKNRLMKKNMPNMPKLMRPAHPQAVENVRSRKNASCSIGLLVRSSTHRDTAPARAAVTNSEMMTGEAQP